MKEDLLKSIYEQVNNREQALPVVYLELFFEGNDDLGSIGCNLLEHPGVQKFYETLMTIRNKENVQDVLVEIMEYDEDESLWPFSERVYILTNTSIDQVSDWVKDLEVSDIDNGYAFGKPRVVPNLENGYSVYSLWWD